MRGNFVLPDNQNGIRRSSVLLERTFSLVNRICAQRRSHGVSMKSLIVAKKRKDWSPATTVLSAITCRDCTAHRMKGIPFTCFSYRPVSIFRNAKPRDKSYAFVSNLCHDKCRSYRQLLAI